MDRSLRGKCKLCDLEFKHDFDMHMFYTLNALEECKYINGVINHYKECHKEKEHQTPFFTKLSVFSKNIIKSVLRDILMIVLSPVSFIVSVLHMGLEWLNDRIGMF